MQLDLFEESLTTEMKKLRKWIARIEKRLYFLEQVNMIKEQNKKYKQNASNVIEQLKMFGT